MSGTASGSKIYRGINVLSFLFNASVSVMAVAGGMREFLHIYKKTFLAITQEFKH